MHSFSSGVCVSCLSPCINCDPDLTATTCTSCIDSFYLSSTTCLPCIANCLNCTSGLACIVCKD